MRGAAPLLAGVELGGTKCVCVLASGPDDVRDERRMATGAPDETLGAIAAVLDEWGAGAEPITALGIAAFGPIELDRASPRFGRIGSAGKLGWGGADVAGRIAGGRDLPLALDTDVNGAALAEGRWGAARGLDDFAYLTVGTGIGVGLIVHGKPIRGLGHAEGGHVRVARAPDDDWPGWCPRHGDCAEGLASGSAILARTGARAETLARDHPVWPLVAHILGGLLAALVFIAAPRRIIVGGGVMAGKPWLFAAIRRELVANIAGYLDAPELGAGIDDYVVAPALGARAGPLGAIALAMDALAKTGRHPGLDPGSSAPSAALALDARSSPA